MIYSSKHCSKEDLKVFIEEKRYWHKRWEEIHRYLMARKEKVGTVIRRRKRANSRLVNYKSNYDHTHLTKGTTTDNTWNFFFNGFIQELFQYFFV